MGAARLARSANPTLKQVAAFLTTFQLITTQPGNVNAGSLRISPPASADSWARMPVQVQLADWRALGKGSRPVRSA